MFFSPRKQYATDKAREIHINETSGLPQLHRLCSDFGFAVLGLCQNSATPKKYVLCEVGLVKGSQSSEKVTPEFDTLAELEAHTAEHMVAIVQKYLFGDEDGLDDESISVA